MKPSWIYGGLKELGCKALLGLLGEHGFRGVEFRTDAGHGVEAVIGEEKRK